MPIKKHEPEFIEIDGHGRCEVLVVPKVAPMVERRHYVRDSMIHPAKMNIMLCRELIRRYTREGEMVLDPMAGIGTTLVEAALLGRNAIGTELEKKFVRITKRNLELLKKFGAKGKAHVIQSDARRLSKTLAEKTDSIIFSPPYGSEQMLNLEFFKKVLIDHGENPNTPRTQMGGRYPSSDNIANLSHGRIDAVITSPPFVNSLGGTTGGDNWVGRAGKWIADSSYGKHSAQIGNLSHGQIDSIITNLRDNGGNMSLPVLYSDNDKNIGNKRGETYLSAMFKVYRECFKVLKPGGRMVLVLKNFIRNKKIVRLDLDTRRLCEAAGFRWVETKLFRLPSKSFWRILYEKKHPDVDTSIIQYEFVEVFEKPGTYC